MTGNNLDESGATPQPRVKLQDYLAMAKQQYGELADEYLKLYPATSDQEAGAASNAAARDSSRVSTHLFARNWQKFAKQPVYTYFWNHAPPGPDHDKRGAYHGSEINYAFNNLYATDRPWTDQDRGIADTMSSYWANIATQADPNGKDLPPWQPFSPASRTVMELGDRFATMPLADPKKIDFWQRFFATQVPW